MYIIKKLIPYKTKRKFKEDLGLPSLHWSLQNIKRLGYSPTRVLDIGAYEGKWTIDLLEVFPKAKVMMFEAQDGKRPILENVLNQFSGVDLYISLLSSEDGKEYFFFENETASHAESAFAEGAIKKVSRSVDSVLREKAFGFPDLIKIDVQGFELEVLRGAKESLLHAEFCLMEVSLLQLGEEPLVIEVMNFMDAEGFQLYDVCQLMRRPFDKALYQMDFLFIRKNSKLIADKTW